MGETKQLCNSIYCQNKKQCCPHFEQVGVTPVHIQRDNRSGTHKESHLGAARAVMLLHQDIFQLVVEKLRAGNLLPGEENFCPRPFCLD